MCLVQRRGRPVRPIGLEPPGGALCHSSPRIRMRRSLGALAPLMVLPRARAVRPPGSRPVQLMRRSGMGPTRWPLVALRLSRPLRPAHPPAPRRRPRRRRRMRRRRSPSPRPRPRPLPVCRRPRRRLPRALCIRPCRRGRRQLTRTRPLLMRQLRQLVSRVQAEGPAGAWVRAPFQGRGRLRSECHTIHIVGTSGIQRRASDPRDGRSLCGTSAPGHSRMTFGTGWTMITRSTSARRTLWTSIATGARTRGQ